MDIEMLLSKTRENLLYIPPGVAALSLVFVSLKLAWESFFRQGEIHEGANAYSNRYKVFDDGAAILTFRILRLLSILSLLGLDLFKLSTGDRSSARVIQIPFFIYLFILSVASTTMLTRWRDIASLHLALLLFINFIIYIVLDGWPYAMISPDPFDSPTDLVTWMRLGLLTFGGLIVPLAMPRPFRPLTADAEPSLLETSSLFSRYTFSYLDSVVLHAFHTSDVTINDMPPLPALEKIEIIGERVLSKFDPVRVGKRSIVWGVLRMWRNEFVIMSILKVLQVFVNFASPFALRQLLGYLETGIPAHGLRPWTWIFVLIVAPLTSVGLNAHYMFIGNRYSFEIMGGLTYLVFHHSLRIRLNSNAPESGKAQINSVDDDSQSSVTPAMADDEENEVSNDEDAATSTTAVSSAEVNSGLEGSDDLQKKTGDLLGKINNLITSDLIVMANVDASLAIPPMVLQLIISIFYLYTLLGWSALVAFGAMLLGSPIPGILGNLMAGVQKKKMQFTDKRVQAATESLGVIRMIKLFGWEPFMLAKIYRKRDEELAKMRQFQMLEKGMSVVNRMLPILAKIAAISIYTLVSKGELLASRIFAALMIFTMLEEVLSTIMATLPNLLQFKVSCDRYTEFLNSTELISEGNGQSERSEINTEFSRQNFIGFKECTFSWDAFKKYRPRTPKKLQGRKQFKLRFDDEVTFKLGKINIIVGPTASGKTSVLMALLGEMYYKPHGLGSRYNLPRDGGIAYAPQEPWVLNETIKENILFGEPYEEQRYKKVLKQCSLEKDLELWEAGDLTEVGEKGLTLSGGQKARVSLARALYSSASILLLDDVLAALDVHTAKWIVDEALQGDLIQGRTVLLVTHNIALTAPVAGHVLVLTRHGTVSAQGPVSEVLKRDSRLRAQVEKEQEEVEETIEVKLGEKIKAVDRVDTEVVKQSTGKLVVAEEKAMGQVERAAIWLYVSSFGGPFVWLSIVGTRALGAVILIFQTWFMGYWSNQYEVHPASEVPVLKYLIFFSTANIAGVLLDDGLSQILWVFRALRASKSIHSKLLQSVFASSFRWLDVTPMGRIITRCTQDMSSIDETFNRMVNYLLTLTISLICLFSSSVIMAGWYALVPGLIIALLGAALGRVYLKCQIGVRREMSNAKAPIVSQVGTALAGLPSIRAYNVQSIIYSELRKRINVYNRATYCFYDINRWITIRVDSLGVIFGGIVAAYLVYGSHALAGSIGFTLSIVLNFSHLVLLWVRVYSQVEIQANSLERMLNFMRIEHEPESTESGKPPAYWPSSGELRVEKLSARYSDDSPTILKDISFVVKSGERVGVVGRTGAGKSSIALSLLRAIKTDGKVYYDGLATDEMNLDALRANITLIPQQPELINGTLRENLDPFGQHDDATLNDALSASGFFSIKDLATNEQHPNSEQNNDSPDVFGGSGAEESEHIGLDTLVESGGTNFSLGQRQIIALARAIVRRSKLLILDEATAAIDYATDAAIQKTLRTEFSQDTTLITIAHRLQTIIDYDKIMVLEAGELVEFDSPRNLLKKESGFFRALVEETEERDILFKLAEEK